MFALLEIFLALGAELVDLLLLWSITQKRVIPWLGFLAGALIALGLFLLLAPVVTPG